MELSRTNHSSVKVILAALGAISLLFIFLIIANVIISREDEDGISQSTPEAKRGFYQNGYISFVYPTDWRDENFSIVGSTSESGVKIEPISPSAKQPKIIVIIDTDSQSTVEEASASYRDFGMSESAVEIGGEEALMFSGTTPSPDEISIEGSEDIIYTTSIHVDREEADYLIKFLYIADQADPKLDNIFLKTVSSIEFLQ